MARYRLTQEAEQDLDAIWTYIDQDNRTAADRVLEDLHHAFDQLGQYPNLGQRREEFGSTVFRFLPVRSYLIAYKPDLTPIEIYRVVSGYRDIANEL